MKQGGTMKRFFVLTLLPVIALAAGPAPYPVSVNSQSPVVTSLQSYQANERTFRVTFKDGTNAVDLTGYTPRMTWATTNTATNVATSSWAYVVSSTSGVVDFTFTPANMNTNGVFIYEVGIDGLPFVYRQGVFAIISSPQGNGAAALTFTNPAGYVATVGSQVYGIGFDQATGAAVLTGSVASAGVITNNQHNAIVGGLTISNVLQWGTNPTPSTAIGASYWSTTYGTKVVNMGFTNLDGSPVMNEEGYNGFVLVQNRSGVTISNGSVVAVIPHPGSILAVVPAMANGSSTNSRAILGMMTMELANNAIGVANNFGEVGALNTASMLEGTEVWLSTNGNGRLTTNYIAEGQVAPFHIGFVSRSHATEGRIFVNVGHHEDDPHWAAESNNYAAAISARLASNVWSVAASTTNYVRRTGDTITGSMTIIGGLTITSGTLVVSGDSDFHNIIADDISAATLAGGGYAITNLNLSPYAGSGLAWTNSKLVMTNASGGGSGSFTNLGIAGSNFTTRAYLTAGSNISFRMNATGATIDATGLATGTPLYVETDSGTNVSARLSSNVWAAADSTTNYVPRTGNVLISGPITAATIYAGTAGDTPALMVQDVGDESYRPMLFDSGNFVISDGSGVYSGNGSGLTNIPLTGLRVTNTASAGQVLATSNGTNGYWTTVGGGSETQGLVSVLSINPNAQGLTPTNLNGAYITNLAARSWTTSTDSSPAFDVWKTNTSGRNIFISMIVTGNVGVSGTIDVRLVYETNGVQDIFYSAGLANMTRAEVLQSVNPLPAGGRYMFTNASTSATVTNGNAFTSIDGGVATGGSGGGITLATNAVIKLPSMRGSWDVSSDVPANGGGAIAFEQPFSTSTAYRASFRTISTSAVARVIQGGPVTLSSVETNWLWFDIDHVGTNAATIQFTAAGATNVLFSQNLTTTGVYRISGTNAAGNRELVPYLYTTNTGPGTTNFSRTWLPVIKAVVQ